MTTINNPEGLQSTDSLKVIAALEDLKGSGKVSDIPVLIDLLHLSPNTEIKTKVRSLLGSLKETGSVPVLIAAIQNQKYTSIQKELVACCWENGLDYSAHLSLFIDLMLEQDFLVAFEAYTVITNMTEQIDQTKLDIEIDRLEKALTNSSEQKRPLILDIIDFLPSIGF